MAISTRAIYFYNANLKLTKQGSLRVDDLGALEFTYLTTPPNINKGALGTVQLAVALPLGTFTGGTPMLTIRTPIGYLTAPMTMSVANWKITEGAVETTYQVFYTTLEIVASTHRGGQHAFAVAYFKTGAYTPLDVAYYVVDDGTNQDYSELDSSAYDEIFTAFSETIGTLQEQDLYYRTFLEGAFGYVDGDEKARKIALDTVAPAADLPLGAVRWNAAEDTWELKVSDRYVIVTDEFLRSSDVTITDIANGHVFQYQDGKVVNKTLAGAGILASTQLDTDPTLAANDDTKIPSQKAVKTYADTKVGLTGNETIGGNKTFTQPIGAQAGVNASSQKITNLATGTADTDAVNKGQMDTKVSTDIGTHNISTVAHQFHLLLIQALEREVARLDGRGKSYGEIPYTTAQLLAMDVSTRNDTINQAIINGFGGEDYASEMGDLVYDLGVGEGVNYHEWEFNGTAWVDNGAINSPKASNTIFGTVKGNDYVNIISGLIQVLKSDYAERLGTSGGDSFTYAQLVSYINATVESMKVLQGVDVDTLTPLTNGQSADLSDYDLVVAEFSAEIDGDVRNDTQIIKVQSTQTEDYRFYLKDVVVPLIEVAVFSVSGTGVLATTSAYGGTLRLTGIKFITTTALTVATTYADTNYLNGKANQDEVNRALDVQVKANADDISDILDGTQTVDKADKDANGNVIDETYETKVDAIEKPRYFGNRFARALVTRLSNAIEPVVIAVVGDSTSASATTKWFAESLKVIAQKNPKYSLIYRYWTHTHENYSALNSIWQYGSLGHAYAYLPGTSGSHLSTPDTNSGGSSEHLDITGDIDLRAKIRWISGENPSIIAKWSSGTSSYWLVGVVSGSNLIAITLYWNDGTTVKSRQSTPNFSVASGDDIWLRCTMDVDNGANGHDIKFYTSSDGVTWNQVGSTYTGSGVTQIASGTALLELGSRSNGAQNFWEGRIYCAEVRNGIDGKIVASPDLGNAFPVGTPTFKDAENNVWTVNGNVVVGNGSPSLTALNGSFPGAAINYAENDTRQPKLLPFEPQIIFFNFSHNEDLDTNYQGRIKGLADEIKVLFPNVGIFVHTQNPQKSPRTVAQINAHAIRNRQIALACAVNDYGLIDAYSELNKNLALYVSSDGVHPSDDGYNQWKKECLKNLLPLALDYGGE